MNPYEIAQYINTLCIKFSGHNGETFTKKKIILIIKLVSHRSVICSTKPIVFHLVTNIHPFYGTLSVIIVFTRPSH